MLIHGRARSCTKDIIIKPMEIRLQSTAPRGLPIRNAQPAHSPPLPISLSRPLTAVLHGHLVASHHGEATRLPRTIHSETRDLEAGVALEETHLLTATALVVVIPLVSAKLLLPDQCREVLRKS